MYEVVAYGKGEINAINHPEIIKWKIFKWHNEQWVEAKGNDKTGKKVTYNFSQKSYAKKILVEAFVHSPELKAPPGLIVKPCLGPRKIKNTQILNVDGSTITKKPKYGQSVLLRVTTENMLGEILKLSVWDRDTLTDTGHDASKNQLLWSGVSKKVNSNGFAEQTVMLSPSMMQLANKSMFDGSEHEYYVLVESKKMKTISTTTQVSNEIQLSPSKKPATKKEPKAEEEVSLMDQASLSITNAIGWVKTKVEGISNAVVSMPDEEKVEKEVKNTGKCYCLLQGITDKSCNGKGNLVSDSHFESLAKDIDVEANVFKAVAIVESGGRSSFVNVNGVNKAKILYERHYMYRLLKKIKTKEELDTLKSEFPDLVHNIGTYKDSSAKYGSEKEQFDKLEKAKQISIDFALQSCSWGKFQIMGKYYKYLYESSLNMEEAMNMCEVQHFAYFKVFLKDVAGSAMINAMKNKNWNKIAELYNGSDYAINNYNTKMKDEYEKL